MRLNFTDEAKYDLFEIVLYFTDKDARKKGLQIRAKLIQAAISLKAHPKLGKIAPLASKKYKLECRSLISSKYKIIYHFDEPNQLISILAFFDTRQSPDKL